MKIKQAKGITLIALVITIIVLLILAGVAISMLTGENGILKQATSAKDTTDKSEFEEQVKLAVMASKVNDKGAIDLTTLEAEIGKIKGTEIIKNGTENNLPWTVKKGSYEVTITADGVTTNTTGKNDGKDDGKKDDEAKIDYGTKKPTEDTRTVIEQATSAKPEGSTIDSNTNSDTGIVMIDSNQNEWVWIEVPATVFTSATSSTDYDNIKADLIKYASDYRDSGIDECVDEWYAMDGETLVTANTEGITEAQKLLNNGCGLTYNEYNTNYKKMLSSIYTNKGFYIGRYEAGIEGSDENTSLARYSRTEITSSSPKAVSKQNMIPYNNVRCSEAQQLATGMITGTKTSSLMYGIQWDLVCKFLEVKGNWDKTEKTAQYYIKENSTSWGNYDNSTFTINSAKAKKYNISNKSCDDITGNKASSSSILLTTGASEQNNKMNIYDFAGNECEWTLEQTTNTRAPCSVMGGVYNDNGIDYPASYRIVSNTTYSYSGIGLRVSLY